MGWFFWQPWMRAPRRPMSPMEIWYATESLAALYRTLGLCDLMWKPERFHRMAMDAAHVTFGDITSGQWRKEFPVGDTITIRVPQHFQAGA